MKYRVDLTPSGEIRLWYDDYTTVAIPSNLVGLDMLREILQHAQFGETKIGQPGAPTQAQIDEYVQDWKRDHPEEPEIINWEGVEL